MRKTLLRLAQHTTVPKSAAAAPPATKLRKPPPQSLEHFIQRQRVIALYRSILRSLFRISKPKRGEPIAYARNEFVRNKSVKDITQIRYLISTGKAEFDSMSRYVDELAAAR